MKNESKWSDWRPVVVKGRNMFKMKCITPNCKNYIVERKNRVLNGQRKTKTCCSCRSRNGMLVMQKNKLDTRSKFLELQKVIQWYAMGNEDSGERARKVLENPIYKEK